MRPQLVLAGQARAAAQAVHPCAGNQRVPALDGPAARHPHARSREAPDDRLRRTGHVRGHGPAGGADPGVPLLLLAPRPRPGPGRRSVRGRVPAGGGHERPRQGRDRGLGREDLGQRRRPGRSHAAAGREDRAPARRCHGSDPPAGHHGRQLRGLHAGTVIPAAARGRRPAHRSLLRSRRRALPAHAGGAAARRSPERLRAVAAHGHQAHARRAVARGRRSWHGPQPCRDRPSPRARGYQPRPRRRQPAEQGAARLHRGRRGGRRPGGSAAGQPGRSIGALATTLESTAAETSSLDAGLERLPATVRQGRSTLSAVRRTATAARPLAEVGEFFRCRYCAVDISHRYKVTQTYRGIHLCGQWICVVS